MSAAYSAFNARDIDAAVTLMSPDVTWPKAFKGGVVNGPNEIRAYWTEQWSEINPRVEPIAFYPQNDSKILVDVHQVVRNLEGHIISDEHVCHRFTIKNGLIQAMELCSLP
ncbi:nuclear transport factor 2 family protein [Cellvibrio sp.]|uniref:nuclear transport factor 2 family protein n=1 Tax=Cellvibrio sp. TaxID=1965322 RepID=UPI00374F1F55